MAYTQEDYQKELREAMLTIHEKAKQNGLFPDPTPEEIRAKADKAERKNATTQRYINDLNQDKEIAKAISYFSDNGIGRPIKFCVKILPTKQLRGLPVKPTGGFPPN